MRTKAHHTSAPVRQKIAVALVDDHPPILEGLRMILERSEAFEVVLSASSGAEFIDGLRRVARADLAMVDLSMKGMNGFELIGWIKQERPEVKAVAYSFSTDLNWVRRALDVGACGYVLKDTGPGDLCAVLAHVMAHGSWHSELALESLALPAQGALGNMDIPARERTFLEFICAYRDWTYEQIADRMGVSRHAVDGYFRYFSRNFGLHSRNALVRWALGVGLA